MGECGMGNGMSRNASWCVRLLSAVSLAVLLCVLPASGQTVHFDFSTGTHGFIAGFADYPVGEETFYELDAGLRPLPTILGAGTSLFITGNNHSDDLFMYYKGRLTGLLPSTPYRMTFDLELASEAEFGSFGIGGSPAHSVYLKAGASAAEPDRLIEDGHYRLSVDKGQQSQPGAAALVLGDVSKPDGAPPGFQFINRASAPKALEAMTSSDGALWLFFGTDSGFEGTTQLYYTDFRATLTPIPEPQTFVIALAASLTFCITRAIRHSLIRH
jgi:hypothetical protein